DRIVTPIGTVGTLQSIDFAKWDDVTPTPIMVETPRRNTHNTGVIAGSAGIEGLDTDKPELVEIEIVDEHVDRSDRIILAHIVIERRRTQRALPAPQSYNNALHQLPRKDRRQSDRANHSK